MLNESFWFHMNELVVPRIRQNYHHLNVLLHVIKNCHPDSNLLPMAAVIRHLYIDEEGANSRVL